jgi:hypothetical protein
VEIAGGSLNAPMQGFFSEVSLSYMSQAYTETRQLNSPSVPVCLRIQHGKITLLFLSFLSLLEVPLGNESWTREIVS